MWEKWVKVLDLLIGHFEDNLIVKILEDQKKIIISELFLLAKKREGDFEELNKGPRVAAESVSLRNLIMVIKIKLIKKFRSNTN
jgi:hypothetical protein